MKLEYISDRGRNIDFTNNNFCQLIEVEGQTSATTDISSVVIGGVDGDFVNNIQTQPRSIVLTLHIKSGVNVEDAKRFILQSVKLKQKGRLVWHQNNRIFQIGGFIESIDMPRWTNSVVMQITMYCDQPFWEDINEVVQQINQALDLHYFTNIKGDMLYFPENGIPLGEYDTIRTKTFQNNGDVEVGMEIEIVAYGQVTNPIIYDMDGNFFGVGRDFTPNGRVDMVVGDIIKINTNRGKKSVTMNGKSLLEKIKPNSTWLMLQAGSNTFSVNSSDESLTNLSFNISYKQRYV